MRGIRSLSLRVRYSGGHSKYIVEVVSLKRMNCSSNMTLIVLRLAVKSSNGWHLPSRARKEEGSHGFFSSFRARVHFGVIAGIRELQAKSYVCSKARPSLHKRCEVCFGSICSCMVNSRRRNSAVYRFRLYRCPIDFVRCCILLEYGITMFQDQNPPPGALYGALRGFTPDKAPLLAFNGAEGIVGSRQGGPRRLV